MYDFDEKPELNITPLVDIMLVLLAILMVTTPAILYEEKINLPNGSKTETSQSKKDFLIIRMSDDGKIRIDQSVMTKAEFPDNVLLMANSSQYSKEDPVYIKADKNLIYDDVVFVLQTLKRMGYFKIALQTNG